MLMLIMKTRKTNGTALLGLQLTRRKHQTPTSIGPGALQPKREVQAIHFNYLDLHRSVLFTDITDIDHLCYKQTLLVLGMPLKVKILPMSSN